MFRFFVLVIFVINIVVSNIAFCDDRDEAVKVFHSAVDAFKAENVEEALGLFQKANDLHPNWKLFFNIGQCQVVLKRYDLAVESFEQYLVHGGDDISDQRRLDIRTEMSEFRDMIGSLEIVGDEGAIVFIDGDNRGVLPLPGRIRIVASINHDLRIEHEGEDVMTRKVRVGAQEIIKIDSQKKEISESRTDASEIVFIKEKPVILPSDEPSDAHLKKVKILAIVGSGLSVAIIGAGVGFTMASNIQADEFNKLNDQVASGSIASDDDKLLSTKEKVESYDKVKLGMFVGGGIVAAVTTGLLVYYIVKSGKKNKKAARVIPGVGSFSVNF